MATYYPSCLSQSQYCTLCNTAQNPANACTSHTSNNSQSNESKCSAYCNSGCNSSCNTAQTICKVHSQYIKDHADVGAYPGVSVVKDDIIYQKWTADYWNSLVNKLNKAESVGRKVSQGSGGTVTETIGNNAPYTAKLYNQVRDKICNFNVSYAKVNKDDLITATVTNAIGTAYNSAKFNSSVCDVCNTDQTMRGGCGCNCSCACSCSCGCPCTCGCPCGCSCSCSNPCSCSSNTATT